jgi:hypothetical protein
MTIPERSGVFLLGPFAYRVSFSSQQRRALNLVAALRGQTRYPIGEVAVVGAGLAGLTASAALICNGSRVTLIEKNDAVLAAQKFTWHRYVHPTLNFWPDREINPTTQFPFFDWFSDDCNKVVSELDREWKENFHLRLNDFLNNCELKRIDYDTPKDGRLTAVMQREKKEIVRDFDAIILAIGFGEERIGLPPNKKYWIHDDLDKLALTNFGTAVVGGIGDGGLIDALRLLYRDLQGGRLIVDTLHQIRASSVLTDLVKAETAARDLSDDNAALSLQTAYAGAIGNIPMGVREKLKGCLLNNGHVTLVGPRPQPYLKTSAPANKFLIAFAQDQGALRFVPGKVVISGKDYSVVDLKGAPVKITAEHWFLRTGNDHSLSVFFSDAEIDALKGRQLGLIDYFDQPLWTEKDLPLIQGYPPHNPKNEAYVASRLQIALKLLNPESFGGKATLDLVRKAGGLLGLQYDIVARQPKYICALRSMDNTTLELRERIPKELFGVPVGFSGPIRAKVHSGGGGAFGFSSEGRTLRAGEAVKGGVEHNRHGTVGGILVSDSGAAFAITASHILRESKNGEIYSWLEERVGVVDAVQLKSPTKAEEDHSDVRPSAELVGLVRLDRDIKFESEVAGFPAVRGLRPTSNAIGALVMKEGARTRVTEGRIVGVANEIVLEGFAGYSGHRYGPAFLVRSIEPTESFSAEGDSGALVLDESGLAVGVVVGGNDDISIVVPLESALPPKGLRFANELDSRKRDVEAKVIPKDLIELGAWKSALTADQLYFRINKEAFYEPWGKAVPLKPFSADVLSLNWRKVRNAVVHNQVDPALLNSFCYVSIFEELNLRDLTPFRARGYKLFSDRILHGSGKVLDAPKIWRQMSRYRPVSLNVAVTLLDALDRTIALDDSDIVLAPYSLAPNSYEAMRILDDPKSRFFLEQLFTDFLDGRPSRSLVRQLLRELRQSYSVSPQTASMISTGAEILDVRLEFDELAKTRNVRPAPSDREILMGLRQKGRRVGQ